MTKHGATLIVVSFAAGALAMFVAVRMLPASSQWFQLDLSSPLAMSTDVAFKSDIELPKITSIAGKAKFLPANDGKGKLGYIVHVTVQSLDLTKVPAKYLKNKPVKVDGVEATRPAIKQVVYEANLELALKDKDGFTLQKLKGPAELVESEASNVLQNTVTAPTPRTLISRTTEVSARLVLQRCNTCVGE